MSVQSTKVKEGLLKKRGEKIKNWRDRYFLLFDDGKFIGYKHKPQKLSEEPLNNFYVTNCKIISSEVPKKNTFIIRFLHDSAIVERIFRCKTENERDDWVTTLEKISSKNDAETYGTLRKEGIDYSAEMFEIITKLGRGISGQTVLARFKENKQVVAIKIINKHQIEEQNLIKCCQTEFDVVRTINHEFIVQFGPCFETLNNYFIVMEYLIGGDLFSSLVTNKVFSEDRTRLYTAEITLALDYLHNLDYVYRDLKLENVLLDLEGHVKLIDFGLCQKNQAVEYNLNCPIGTNEYIAPEVCKGESKALFSQDWWSLGVLVYECLHGSPPFFNSNFKRLFNQICTDKPAINPKLSPPTMDFIEKLLEKDPLSRLNANEKNSDQVKSHAFFRPFSWNDVQNKRIKPQFVPTITGPTDIRYFENAHFRNNSVPSTEQLVDSTAENSE